MTEEATIIFTMRGRGAKTRIGVRSLPIGRTQLAQRINAFCTKLASRDLSSWLDRMAIDFDGMVWSIDQGGSMATKIDPKTYTTADSWTQSQRNRDTSITLTKVVERCFELVAGRAWPSGSGPGNGDRLHQHPAIADQIVARAQPNRSHVAVARSVDA